MPRRPARRTPPPPHPHPDPRRAAPVFEVSTFIIFSVKATAKSNDHRSLILTFHAFLIIGTRGIYFNVSVGLGVANDASVSLSPRSFCLSTGRQAPSARPFRTFVRDNSLSAELFTRLERKTTFMKPLYRPGDCYHTHTHTHTHTHKQPETKGAPGVRVHRQQLDSPL